MEKSIVITVEMSEDQAEAYSQFLKRVSFTDYHQLAASDAEAYAMQEAGERIRKELANNGFNPR